MVITRRTRAIFLFCCFAISLTVIGLVGSVQAADTDATTAAAPIARVSTNEFHMADASATNAEDFLRSYLQIQDQLHSTQLAIEKNREEAEAWATSSARVLDERLGLMEKSLAAQRLDELTSRANANHVVLMTAGVFGGVGFFVLLTAAALQWTAANRLAIVKASVSATHALEQNSIQQSVARFSELIEGLEGRIQNLESAGTFKPSPLQLSASENAAENLPVNAVVSPVKITIDDPKEPKFISTLSEPDKIEAINSLIGKAQTLLQSEKAEAALGHLDEALALDPQHVDALVKKGAALERLQRFEEALEYYDRAIVQDNALTMAYLYKGGVFNRMERYGEALECYEQALKTRQKGHAANVIIA